MNDKAMTRARRKQQAREEVRKKKIISMTTEAWEATLNDALAKHRSKIVGDVVRQMSIVFATVLHDKLDFGHKRVVRTLEQVEDLYDSIKKGYVDVETLNQTLKNEIKVVIV